MVDTGRRVGSHQCDDLVGHINCPGRLSALIINNIDGCSLAFEPDHRFYEISSVSAVEPRGPHDVTSLGQLPEYGFLSGQLCAPICGAGTDVVKFGIWALGVPAEYVISRYVHEAGSVYGGRSSKVGNSLAVHQQCFVLMTLGLIYFRPGCTIHNNAGRVIPKRRLDGCLISDVKIPACEANHVLAVMFKDCDEIAAKHPSGADDQPPAHEGITTLVLMPTAVCLCAAVIRILMN